MKKGVGGTVSELAEAYVCARDAGGRERGEDCVGDGGMVGDFDRAEREADAGGLRGTEPLAEALPLDGLEAMARMG